jgi:ATP-dependent Clp protease ATP-binding subunit ClpA
MPELEDRPDEREESDIDKTGIIEKLRKHFTISAFNRVDKVIVFNDLASRSNLRDDFARKEVLFMFETIDEFYRKKSNTPPPRAAYGDHELLAREALEHSHPSGGFRAIKRYILNTILGRVLSSLHAEYPNKLPNPEKRVVR